MTDYRLVPVEQIRRALYALEKFANDTLTGRNAADELRELLSDALLREAAQPEQITPKELARLIADNPDVQFSAKPRPADEELRRDAERMKFAAEAPNLHGQVYLSCRLRGASHQQALDLAHDAEKMYGPEQVSEADLRIILEEISDAIADEEKENSND